MDTITHIVLGAALGEVIAGKKMGKRAMLWGALANNVPDIDVLFSAFQKIPDSLLSHRGFTHSILFAVIMGPALAWIFNQLYRKKNYGFLTWYAIFGSGMFIHILIDSFTNYGTGWFEPFSHYRVSFNTIFVADPFFTVPLLIAFIALLVLRIKSPRRKYWLAGGFGVSVAYLLFTFINKVNIDRTFERALSKKQNSYSYITTPTPLNNFLWYDLARADSGFYIGYRSIFDKSPEMELTFIPKKDFLLGDLKTDPRIEKLIRFSQGYYCITPNDSAGVDFHDMRFGQIGGWDDPNAPFVFTYQITKTAYNMPSINEGRYEASTGKAFESLWKRIRGVPE
jgi:inner membrane protein